MCDLGDVLHMLVLAIDTSGRLGSIALAHGHEDGSCDVIEVVPLAGGTFSAQLVPQVAAFLSKHGFTKYHIDAFAVASGPGSFTGLRVGLSAVKGLAEVLKIPIATVTSLELLIAASQVPSNVLAVLDAGRSEVYAGLQLVDNREELLLSVSEAAALAKERNLQVIAADASLATSFEDSIVVSYHSSEVAARIGIKKLLEGNTVDVLALDANYIRRSEAEYKRIS